MEAVAGTTRDITEIKPAPTLILMGDNLVVEQINQSMLRMIGHTEEIIGMPFLRVMPELAGSYIWSEVLKVYNEGTPFDQQEVLVTHKRTGEMKDYYYNIAYRPLREEGKIIGMIQVAIDVTEQVQTRKKIEESEARYRILSTSLERQVAERTRELQRSNEDLQQFAHVASHDLKEPVRKIKTFTGRLQQHLEDKLDDESSGTADDLLDKGIPSTKYFAAQLNLSSDYLSDILTKFTGKTTQEHIHLKIIERAKVNLNGPSKSISQIAYQLGFEHPSHFTKLFKRKRESLQGSTGH